MIGIYKITSPSGKVYIGQTIDHERRFRHYKNLSCKEQPRLYRSLVKYGVENHTFEIIYECAKIKLTQWERHYQELYNSVGKNGLNCILVRTDEFSGGHSEESKKKISDAMKGRKPSKKQNEWLINYNKTRILSLESREKLSKANLGKKYTKERIEKAAKARIGLKRSEETKKKISESSKARCTDEWKLNMQNKLKGRVFKPETIEKMRIAALNRKNKDN